MIALRLLACVAALPFMVKAELFGFLRCGNFLDVIDRTGQTYGGVIELVTFLAQEPRVYLWNSNNLESDNKCLSLRLNSNMTFEHKYFNVDGELVTHTGAVEYSMYPTAVLTLSPTDPEDGDPETDGRLPLGILSANRDGVAKLQPVYISATEVMLMSCLDAFLGHTVSFYVMSVQDLSLLGTECAIETIQELTGVQVEAHGNMTMCEEMSAGDEFT